MGHERPKTEYTKLQKENKKKKRLKKGNDKRLKIPFTVLKRFLPFDFFFVS